jgi:hypothetical protein
MNARQRRYLCHSIWLIIEADDGNVARNLESHIQDRFHRSDRAIIITGYQGCKF